jgi:hypothetical protein
MLSKEKQLKKQKELDKMKNILNYSLSDSDIKTVLGHDTKIIEYKDLNEYNSIYDLLPNEKDFVIVLVESKHNSGHWCALLRYNNTIELWDSYGGDIANELNYITRKMNQILHQNKAELHQLLKTVKATDEIIYSTTKLQEEGPDIATCGRHACLRVKMCMHFGYDLEQYLKFFIDKVNETGLCPDVLVCKLIPIYN